MTPLVPLPTVDLTRGLNAGGATLADFKNYFFDAKAVTDAVDAATRQALSKMGAYVMRTARGSIKSRPGASAVGSPPHAHDFFFGRPNKKTGKATKRYRFRTSILFGYDPGRGVLVVGPYLFAGARTNPTVPERNEKGAGGYDPRPFMVPAVTANRDKFPYFFQDSV